MGYNAQAYLLAFSISSWKFQLHIANYGKKDYEGATYPKPIAHHWQ
jgi:hypothetical protein